MTTPNKKDSFEESKLEHGTHTTRPEEVGTELSPSCEHLESGLESNFTIRTDPEHNAKEQTLTIDVPKQNMHLSKIPYDIVVLIFKELGIGAATCLGLTCQQFYHCLKMFHPTPISLNSHVPILPCKGLRSECVWFIRPHLYEFNDWCACLVLGVFLQQWVGPKYRLGPECIDAPFRFLSKSVYGEGTEPESSPSKSKLLIERYNDWGRILYFHEDENRVGGNDSPKSILPSPFNLGETWNLH
ncbi:hypothetical protein EG329_007900 [Mollisiaceae sp. DMI_Dod_QoI]|nr:hypothetical protein EG329_007900 [Helotiales sp. DMI_Dod_QoI]